MKDLITNKVNGPEWMEDLIGLERSYVIVLALKVIETIIIKVKTELGVFITNLN